MCTLSAGGGASGGANLLLGRLAAGPGAGGALVGADGVVSGCALRRLAGLGAGGAHVYSWCRLWSLRLLFIWVSVGSAWLTVATLGQLHFGLVVCHCRVAAASKSRIYFASSEYLPPSELLFCHFFGIYNGNREGFDL